MRLHPDLIAAKYIANCYCVKAGTTGFRAWLRTEEHGWIILKDRISTIEAAQAYVLGELLLAEPPQHLPILAKPSDPYFDGDCWI